MSWDWKMQLIWGCGSGLVVAGIIHESGLAIFGGCLLLGHWCNAICTAIKRLNESK